MWRGFSTSTIFLHRQFDELCILCRLVKFTMEVILYKGPRLRNALAISDRGSDVFELQPKSKIET